jgi:uncharacterized protein (TIGR01615 family)
MLCCYKKGRMTDVLSVESHVDDGIPFSPTKNYVVDRPQRVRTVVKEEERDEALLRQRLLLFTSVPSGALRILYIDVKRVLDRRQRDGDAVDLVEVTADLYMSGHIGTRVCKNDEYECAENVDKQNFRATNATEGKHIFYNLRHEYIIVDIDDCGEALVETAFRDHFRVARPSASYARLLDEVVPDLFVGTRARLECAVRLLCREMHVSLRGAGLDVPPWRTEKALLNKWNIVTRDMKTTSNDGPFYETEQRRRQNDINQHVIEMQGSGWYN